MPPLCHDRQCGKWEWAGVVLLTSSTLVLLSAVRLGAGGTSLASTATILSSAPTVQDTVRGMTFQPGDAFGKAYELPADRLRSYPGGVAWHRNKGWSYATPDSLPAPSAFPGTLARVSKALKASMASVEEAADSEDAAAAHSSKSFSHWTPWTVPGVSDEDYKRDVMRGVLKEHTGFPELPDCPTEGLWGSYRAGYAPGQKLGAGNCQDYSLRSTGVPAGALAPKLGFDVKSWDKLWKEDLKGLKKARSYAKLTKGLWAKVAPDAAMAYYLPSSYKGSLAEYYQEPRGERTATENNAHDNSIVPVPGHKGPYYSSDFTRGEAAPAPTPPARVYGNRPGTNEDNQMAPLTQGLYSGSRIHQDSGRKATHLKSGVGLSTEEEKVEASLHALNERERRRLAVTRGVRGLLLKSPLAAHTTALSAKAASASSQGAARQKQAAFKPYTPLSKTTTSALTEAYTGLLYPPPQTRVAVFGQAEDDASADDMEDKAQLALKHFKRLRKKLLRWRKYFRSNKFDGKTKPDTGVPPNEANENGDPDAYFWCYSHYGDLTPDKLTGEYPDFEECLHVLGGARWGPRKGGDEAMAYGDVVEPRPGIENTLKERRGFGDGYVAATNPHPDDWKYFENEDEEFGGETRNTAVMKREDGADGGEDASAKQGGEADKAVAGQEEGGDAGAQQQGTEGEGAGLDGLVKGMAMSSASGQSHDHGDDSWGGWGEAAYTPAEKDYAPSADNYAKEYVLNEPLQ